MHTYIHTERERAMRASVCLSVCMYVCMYACMHVRMQIGTYVLCMCEFMYGFSRKNHVCRATFGGMLGLMQSRVKSKFRAAEPRFIHNDVTTCLILLSLRNAPNAKPLTSTFSRDKKVQTCSNKLPGTPLRHCNPRLPSAGVALQAEPDPGQLN